MGTAAVPPGPPATPSIRAGHSKSSSIAISWAPPAYLGGAPIKNYRVVVSAGAEPPETWVEAYNGPELKLSITGCPPGTKYFAVVYAANSAGESAPSEMAHYTTDAAQPLAPANLRAEQVGPTKLTLVWDEADGRGTAVTQYRLDMAAFPAPDSEPSFETIWSGVKCSAEAKNLQPNAHYLFRVQVGENGNKNGKDEEKKRE